MLSNTFLKKYDKFFYISIFAILSFITGCEKEEDSSVQPPQTSTAKIEGRIMGSSSYSTVNNTYIAGASVYLSEVNQDGSIHKISQSNITSDQNGNFLCSIDYSSGNRIIVTAIKGSKTWKSFINNDIKNGLTYYVQPLNDESTSEADVYIEAIKNNNVNVSYPDISIFVDEVIAQKLTQEIVTPSQIASVINDVKNIEASTISNKQFVSIPIDLTKLNNAKYFAQSLLERNLYYSKSQSDYDAAFASFYEAIVNSYTSSGIEPEVFYKMLEIADRALLRSITSFDATTKIEIEKRASEVRAYVLNYAVQSIFNKLNPDPQTYNLIVGAGGKLFLDINQSSTHDGIIANFTEYHAETLDIINKLLGVRSDIIKTLDKRIGDLKSGLITSVNGEISIDSLINQYLNFFSDAASIIAQTVNSEDDDNQIKLAADILVLLNLQF